jgi:hypothetical protein
MASNGRASKTDPKPDNPWVKAAKNTITHTQRYVPISFSQRDTVYPMYTIFFLPSASLLLFLQRAEWYLRGLFYTIYGNGSAVLNPIFFMPQADP